MLDDTDRRILRQYQAEPDAPVADLASRAGVTPSTWGRRLDRMRRDGVIEGLEAVIDWRALGYEITVSLRFPLDKIVPRGIEEFLDAARAILTDPDRLAAMSRAARIAAETRYSIESEAAGIAAVYEEIWAGGA